jgi:hypothetical protein
MRKSVIIICIAVLTFCLWLLLHRNVENNPETRTQETNLQPVNPVINSSQVATSPRVPNVSTASTAEARAKFISTPAGSNALQQRILTDWQRPIEFYGKVIDENTNPIAGAHVNFRWMETPNDEGSRITNVESDTEGLFSLQDQRGPSLSVSVSKEGYYVSHKDQTGFSYLHGDFSPVEWEPVIFHLHKIGHGESLVELKRNYRIPRDGTPVSINLTTGATATSESGDFVVQCWTQDAGKRSGEKYDWRCVVSVPGGGAVMNNEEFAFQ